MTYDKLTQCYEVKYIQNSIIVDICILGTDFSFGTEKVFLKLYKIGNIYLNVVIDVACKGFRTCCAVYRYLCNVAEVYAVLIKRT